MGKESITALPFGIEVLGCHFQNQCSKRYTMDLRIKSFEEYKAKYAQSVEDPEGFWDEIAKTFNWQRGYDRVLNWEFVSSFSEMTIEAIFSNVHLTTRKPLYVRCIKLPI